jgi:hypothetical protein
MPSNRAKEAAETAAEILKATEHVAAVDSEAAEILREKEEAFESAAKEMEATQASISETIAELRDGKSARATRMALKKLAEQLHAAEAVANQAAKQMREVTAPQANGETMKETPAKAKKGGTEKSQAVKDSDAAGGKKQAGTGGQPANGDDSSHAEELKAVEAEAIEKVTNILHKAGSQKNAEALSRIAAELKKAEDAIKEAAVELQAAEKLKEDSASRKVANELKTVETVAEEAGEKLKAAGTALKKTVKATQDKLKQPTYDVWKAAYEKISAQAKIVDDILEKAGKQGRSSAGKDELNQLKEYKEKTDKTKREARNSYDSAMVMEKLLDVREFFLTHKERIYDRLEECDRIAKNAVTNADMLFFAESLPIINGIIHVGSTREELNKATDWVRENWEGQEAQPRIVLSALLFRYVTKEGAKEFADSTIQRKKTAWHRINDRVSRLL